jgi:hypothetical protein
MTTARTARLIAFTLSLMMTLVIFSGVTSLSAPEHAGQWLVQAPTSESPRS